MQTDYSRAILKYLMDYSNMDYPVNIHQIYEHLFYGQELSDNKKRGKLDTIRKNIVGLHASGLIEMDTEFTENTGKKERYKKEDDDVTIWYEQKLDTEYALILIQKIMEMNNLSFDDKKNLVQAICDCAGSKIMESASYAQNVIKSNVYKNYFKGKNVIIEIDSQGARQIREKQKIQSVLLIPPSFEELLHRLKNRGTESKESIHRRLKQALDEIEHIEEYGVLLVNDSVEGTAFVIDALFHPVLKNASGMNERELKIAREIREGIIKYLSDEEGK